MEIIDLIESESGFTLEYEMTNPNSDTCIMFVHGTYANKGAIKAQKLKEKAIKMNVGFFACDMHCHGASDGEYNKDFRISRAAKDVKSMLKEINKNGVKKVIIASSSMGAWATALAIDEINQELDDTKKALSSQIKDIDSVSELKGKEKTLQSIKNSIAGQIMFSPAPDHHQEVGFVASNEQLRKMFNVSIDENGTLSAPIGEHTYVYTKEYLADAQKCAVIGKKIDLMVPSVVIGGSDDALIKPEKMTAMARCFTGGCDVNIIPKGTHDMNGKKESVLMLAYVENMVLNAQKSLAKSMTLAAQHDLNIQYTRV